MRRGWMVKEGRRMVFGGAEGKKGSGSVWA